MHQATQIFVCVLLAVCAGCATSKKVAYTFTQDGEPHTPLFASESGDKEQLRSGDVIWPHHMAMIVREPGTYHLITTPEEDGRVLLQKPDGSQQIVGAKVSWTFEGPYEDRKTVFHNPLSRMTPAEIHGLWGVTLDAWPKGIEELLKNIDPARTCIMFDDNVLEDDPGRLSGLPSDIRYLRIYENSASRDLKSLDLSKFTRLRHLHLSHGANVDLKQLRCFETLEYLSGSGNAVTNIDSLAQMHNLKFLDLGWCRVHNVEFAKHLKQLEVLVIDATPVTNIAPLATCRSLRVLNISRTPVTDLSALSYCGKLRSILASESLISSLPQSRMPALEELRVMNTKLSDEAVAAFRATNPQCKVFHRWHRTLQQLVEKADTIKVLEWKEAGDRTIELQPVHTISRAGVAKEVLDAIAIDEEASGFHCMCIGGPAIGFYGGTNAMAKITLHHGTGMRWDEGWPGDAALTPASQVAIAKWFEKNGYPNIEKARLASIEEAKQEEREDREFWECFPNTVRDYFLSAPWTNGITDYNSWAGGYWSASNSVKAEIAAKVTEMLGDPVTAVVSVCKAMGSRKYPYSWSGRSERESMAVSVATNVPTEAFLKALSIAEGDEKAMCGAALLFFSERHGNNFPKEHQVTWCLKLSDFVLRGKGYDEKTSVLYWLMRAGTPETIAMVRNAASGKYGEVEFRDSGGIKKTGIRATACLLLAMAHDDVAKKLVPEVTPLMKNEQDIAALELCAILTGMTNRVKQSHFEIIAWTIPDAAAQAVVENQNQENIDLLVNFAINHDYASVSHPALEAFAKIAGFDWYKNGERPQPGHRDKAKVWWTQNRQRFRSATQE